MSLNDWRLSFIKRFIRRGFFLFYPKPIGIRALGIGSAILFPRKIEGVGRISVGDDSIVLGGSWISAYTKQRDQRFDPYVAIGSGVRIGHNAMITAIDRVSIGDGCLLSGDVFISDHSHGHEYGKGSPVRQPLVPGGAVTIGKNCFIGIRAVIMPGVTLGDGCVVGANSVVTKSFPAGSVIAGAPARLIRIQDESVPGSN